MAQFSIFVGRKQELSKITTFAEAKNETGGNHLILVDGDGGVGKTFLLQKIAKEYRAKGYLVDYYDLAEQPPGKMREAIHLKDSLGEQNFPNFAAKLDDLASGQRDIGDPSLPQLEKDALTTCLNELNNLIVKSGKRFIRLMDTFELSPLQQTGDKGLFEVEKQIINTLFIVAGRDIQRFAPDFKASFGEGNITEIDLKGFSEEEAEEFFNRVDENSQISDEMRKKLVFLTSGRPVLLALSVEWRKHKIPLPEIITKSLEQLQALKSTDEWADLNSKFEFDLVDSVRSLKSPTDKAILYMAVITRRFDGKMVEILLGGESEKLLTDVANLSFVRSNPANQACSLHDEMRKLVNQYAWPIVDPSWEGRKNLIRKVIQEYYEPRIKQIAAQIKGKLQPEKGPIPQVTISNEEWEQWRLEAECLYYHLRLGENEGRTYFDRQYGEARRWGHSVRMQFLLSEIDSAIQSYPALESIRKLKTAEQLLIRGELDQAKIRCQEILSEKKLPLDDQISVNIMLGLISARREPQCAEDYFNKALDLASQKNNKGTIGIIYNNLGQFYSNASRLDEAIRSYEEAIKNSQEAGNEATVASATNNLAFVYRLKGNLEMASVKYRQAWALRKRLGIERDLAYSYLTKSEIDRDQGDLEDAEHSTKLALQIFRKINDMSGQSTAFRSLANIYRHRDMYSESEEFLRQGISLAEQRGDDSSLARLYHVYGQEQRRYASQALKSSQDINLDEDVIKSALENAENHLKKSQTYAQKYRDQRLLAHNELEFVILYFLGKSRSENELFALLDEVEKKAIEQKDDLLLGHINELRGDIALRSKDYASAAKYIGIAAKQMGKYSGREVSHFIERAAEHLVDVTLGTDEIRTLALGILEATKDSNEKIIYSLKLQCEEAVRN